MSIEGGGATTVASLAPRATFTTEFNDPTPKIIAARAHRRYVIELPRFPQYAIKMCGLCAGDSFGLRKCVVMDGERSGLELRKL